MIESFTAFINDYKMAFHKNIEGFYDLVENMSSYRQLSHLKKKMAIIPLDLVFIIDDIVQ